MFWTKLMNSQQFYVLDHNNLDSRPESQIASVKRTMAKYFL